MKTTALLHQLFVAIVVAAAANVLILLALGGSYDTRLGPLHFVAHGLFKPLLILNGAFLLALLFGNPRDPEGSPRPAPSVIAPAALAMLAALALLLSFTVNPLYDEWNYRGLSSTYQGLGDLAHLFVSKQIGVWYRPVGFVSLWLDYALFHQHVWAYHFQNILLHFANAFLVSILARRLGLIQIAARWAGALFLAASITYEPAMWPSARFDLWAMFFTALALLASLDYLAGQTRGRLWLALACYALAVGSKESGYAFPVLLVLLAINQRFDLRRLIPLGVGVLLVTGALLAIRHAVLGGAGGYPGNNNAPSIHLSFTFATLRIVLARAMQMSLFSVNLNHSLPWIMSLVIGALVIALAVAAIVGASTTGRQRLLVAFVLAATLPVAPLISWLDSNAQHVRYLYMPAAFVAMLAAAALSNTRRPTFLLFVFGVLNLCCGVYNTWVYKTTYQHSAELARAIATDLSPQPAPAHVKIVGMPEEYNGVLFSRFELEYKLEEMLPGVAITFEQTGRCSDPSCYLWQPADTSLQRCRAGLSACT